MRSCLALTVSAQRMRGVECILRVLDDPLEIWRHRITEMGDGYFPPAREQWTSEFCFQPFDAPGESWLGNTAALCCSRKVQLLAEHEKVPDLLKLHVPT
jgi:hypothetical protein